MQTSQHTRSFYKKYAHPFKGSIKMIFYPSRQYWREEMMCINVCVCVFLADKLGYPLFGYLFVCRKWEFFPFEYFNWRLVYVSVFTIRVAFIKLSINTYVFMNSSPFHFLSLYLTIFLFVYMCYLCVLAIQSGC